MKVKTILSYISYKIRETIIEKEVSILLGRTSVVIGATFLMVSLILNSLFLMVLGFLLCFIGIFGVVVITETSNFIKHMKDDFVEWQSKNEDKSKNC